MLFDIFIYVKNKTKKRIRQKQNNKDIYQNFDSLVNMLAASLLNRIMVFKYWRNSSVISCGFHNVTAIDTTHLICFINIFHHFLKSRQLTKQ